jgi:hypothetical protein
VDYNTARDASCVRVGIAGPYCGGDRGVAAGMAAVLCQWQKCHSDMAELCGRGLP